MPVLLALPLLVLGALGSGDAEAVQAVAVAVDRRGHKRDREDAAVLSRPVRVGEGDGGAKGWVVRLPSPSADRANRVGRVPACHRSTTSGFAGRPSASTRRGQRCRI